MRVASSKHTRHDNKKPKNFSAKYFFVIVFLKKLVPLDKMSALHHL